MCVCPGLLEGQRRVLGATVGCSFLKTLASGTGRVPWDFEGRSGDCRVASPPPAPVGPLPDGGAGGGENLHAWRDEGMRSSLPRCSPFWGASWVQHLPDLALGDTLIPTGPTGTPLVPPLPSNSSALTRQPTQRPKLSTRSGSRGGLMRNDVDGLHFWACVRPRMEY